MPQPPSPCTLELMFLWEAITTRSLSATATGQPCSPELEKACAVQQRAHAAKRRPAQPKTKTSHPRLWPFHRVWCESAISLTGLMMQNFPSVSITLHVILTLKATYFGATWLPKEKPTTSPEAQRTTLGMNWLYWTKKMVVLALQWVLPELKGPSSIFI